MRTPFLRKEKDSGGAGGLPLQVSTGTTKPDIVVPVVRVVVVASRTTAVIAIVVPRAAPQHFKTQPLKQTF